MSDNGSDGAPIDNPLFGLATRLPPSNVQAEQGLVGALLAENRAYDRVSPFLSPDHFYDPLLGKIYQAIGDRIAKGQLADAVTLRGQFSGADADYLGQLLTAMVGVLNVAEYGRAIHDAWAKRELIAMGSSMIAQAFGDTEDPVDTADQIAGAQDALATLATATETGNGDARQGTTPASEAVRLAIERAGRIHAGVVPGGIPTGIVGLDQMLGGGVQPATLTYLAGLGEVGKTALAVQIAEHVADRVRQDWSRRLFNEDAKQVGPCPAVVFFTFDMTAVQIGIRQAARLGGIPAGVVRRGELSDATCRALMAAQAKADELPIEYDDREPATLSRVVSAIRAFARKRPCALAIIDNLSKIIGAKSGDQLFPAFLNATNVLKMLTKSTGIPIMLLLHLPQSVAKRENTQQTPRRGDLPYGIHMHADFAFGLWRPELSLPASAPARNSRQSDEQYASAVDRHWKKKQELAGIGEIVPLKLREDDGDSRVVRMRFDRQTQAFTELGVAPSDRNDVAPEDLWEHE